LFDLARASSTTIRRRRDAAQQRVRPGVQRILDAMTGCLPTCGTAAGTSCPRIGSATRSTPSCTSTRRDRRILLDSFSQPSSAHILPRLGAGCERHGGDPAHRGRPEPVRPQPL
jgi:hypothetical protein